MRIRVLPPKRSLWKSIRKRRKYYYIVRNGTKNSTKFITLDVGTKGGLMFIRGVPSKSKLKVGDRVKNDDFLTQSVRVEYNKIKTTHNENPINIISKLMNSPYYNWILKFIQNEYDEEIDIFDIIPKGDGFQIQITFVNSKKTIGLKY